MGFIHLCSYYMTSANASSNLQMAKQFASLFLILFFVFLYFLLSSYADTTQHHCEQQLPAQHVLCNLNKG